MVNYHAPDVVLQGFCAYYAFEAKYMGSESQLTFSDSDSGENLAFCGWTLLVSRAAGRSAHNISNNNNPSLISSWEFVTTLDYEWSVIRGHRPYRWTIWVRISALFCSVSLPGRSGHWTKYVSHLADLLHFAHLHSHRYNSYPCKC